MLWILRLIAALSIVGILEGADTIAHAATPSWSVADVTCPAVAPANCAVKLVKTGRNGLKSQISYGTAQGTAKSGIDYTARSGGFMVNDATMSATVNVPILKLSATSKFFYFRIYAKQNAVLGKSLAIITIPAQPVTPPPPPPVVCPDGTTLPAGSTCPTPPPPVVCPDGTTLPAGSTCPPPPPPPSGWVKLPDDGWNGLKLAAYARATKNCSSIYRSAETDRVGITFHGVTAGTVYRLVPPNMWGIATSWGWTQEKNIDGQTGNTWVVLALDTPDPIPAYPWSATVAQECLEGVKLQ